MTKRAADHDAVLAALQLYIDGTYEGSADKLRKAFHEKAMISGYIHTPQSPPEGVLMVAPMEALYGHMQSSPSPQASGAPYAARVGEVTVRGDLARAVVYEDGLEGHDYVNELQLHRQKGRWLIVSKAFSADPS